jgi:hypothetical protein
MTTTWKMRKTETIKMLGTVIDVDPVMQVAGLKLYLWMERFCGC